MSYNPARFNPSTTDPNRDVTYTTDSTGLRSFHSAGYELDGIEGYIYQRCTPEPAVSRPGPFDSTAFTALPGTITPSSRSPSSPRSRLKAMSRAPA